MKILKYSLIASAMGLTPFYGMAAKYQIVELAGNDLTRHSFATGVNNNDEVIGVARNHFNFPVDLDNLNYVSLGLAIASAKLTAPDDFVNVNIDDIQNGDINAESLDFIRLFLAGSASLLTQKVGDQSAFINDATGTSEVAFFDEFDTGLNSKTRNTVDLYNAINDNGISVATTTGLYQKKDFTPEPTDATPEPSTITYWQRAGLNGVGVIAKGDQRVAIPSMVSDYGGESYLTDISNSNYVVGYAAANLTQTAVDGFEATCVDVTDPLALDVCIVNLYASLAATAFNMYEVRAFRWKINDALEIVETLDLGLSFTPLEGDNRTHKSFATGVNEQGHVAGYSDDFLGDVSNTAATRQFATYHNGETMTRITDPEEYFEGKSFDINDNNIVVGFSRKVLSSLSTSQFFHYDGNTDTVVYPENFFTSSASEAYAVNNAGIIVGKAQIDSSFGNVRREVAFTYDINTSTLSNLNDFTACDSPYTLVEARDINDAGVIAATALLIVDKRDAKGVIMTDTDGTALTEEVPRAVKLVPIAGGEVDDCDPVSVDAPERQGASMGWYGLLFLFGLFTRRKLVR